MKTSFVVGITSFVLLGALAVSPFIPKLVSAQTAIIPSAYSNCGNYSTFTCTPGVLHVFLTVNNPYQGTTKQPSDFVVTVTAQGSAPVTFPGSQSGTNLSVLGFYTVSAQSLAGYTPSYSVGCSDSIINGKEATCLITESPSAQFYTSPVPYPYPYSAPVLQCAPATQTVGLGQSATFSVQGNAGGPFTWATSDRTYQAVIGPTFTTTFANTGTQLITVTNNTQTAVCAVDVVAGAVPAGYAASAYVPPAATYPATYPVAPSADVSVTNYPAPGLPNTGFAPISPTQVAVLLSILTALGFALAPYVRKTIVAIG